MYVFDIVENAFSRAAQKKRRDPGKLTSSSAVNHQAALFIVFAKLSAAQTRG